MKFNLRRKGNDRGWPGYILWGRVRTSTAGLLAAFILLSWVSQTFQPEPKPPEASQIVPPGFVPDPEYTWVPRTNVQERPRETRQTYTTTTTTTTTPSPTTTTTTETTPTDPNATDTSSVPTTVVDPDGPGPAGPTTLSDPDGTGPLPPQTAAPSVTTVTPTAVTPTTVPPVPAPIRSGR